MTLAQHILVATDFSEASAHAHEAGAALAKASGAKVTLLHIYDLTSLAPPAAIPRPQRVEHSIETEMRRTIDKELQRIACETFAGVSKVEPVARVHRHAAIGMCEYAEKHQVDVIVLGTHGRSGLTRFFIGSVAEKVVRRAPCSVLAVRPKKSKRKSKRE